MNFRRSSSALQSIHVFFSVDIVVFCEGGSPLKYEDAVSTIQSSETLDTLYWSMMLDYLKTDKKYHVKSVGTKDIINAIASDVAALGIKTVSVCRDSDYDFKLGCPMPEGRVGYTYGYSWENDVTQLPVLEGLVGVFLGNGQHAASVRAELRTALDQFSKDLTVWTEIDISLSYRRRGSIFSRQSPLAAINVSHAPRIKSDVLIENLRELGYRGRPKAIYKVKAEEVLSCCYGKIVSKSIYHAFGILMRKYISFNVTYEIFLRLLISQTRAALTAGRLPQLAHHLENQSHILA